MSAAFKARIERITAHAALAESNCELRRAEAAAAAGDPDWARWIDDHRAGRAVVVALDVTIEFRCEDGELDRVHAHDESVWLERHVDPPVVQEQIRQVASKEFGVLNSALREHRVATGEADLDDMYIEVELARSLRDDLASPGALERGERLNDEPWELSG